MALTPFEQRALAEIEDGLRRSAPHVVACFSPIHRPRRRKLWASALGGLCVAAGLVGVLGSRGVVVLVLVSVMSAPVLAGVSRPSIDGQPEDVPGSETSS